MMVYRNDVSDIALALCPECLRWIAEDLRRKPLEDSAKSG